MKDFCNATDRDCIRLIVAQDLKESGIDIDSSNLNNINSNNTNNFNTTNGSLINTSQHHHHHHNHHHHNSSHHLFNKNPNANGHKSSHLSNNTNLLNTSCSAATTGSSNSLSSCSKHHGNKSINIVNENNPNGVGLSSAGSCCNCSNNQLKMMDAQLSQHDSQLTGTSRVFGISLKQIEMVNINLNDQLLTVPSFLKYAIEYINDYIQIEGIFRRNGTASRLKELKKQVEEGVYNFSQFAVFDLTSLIKLFFREMPESLLTFSLYSNFIQAVKLDTTKSKLESILNLCLQLPDLNLHLLIYLMHFLKQITLQESLNKMNSFNLAVCFAPNIIYTRINKVNDLYINEERIVVQLLIENSSLIGKVSDSVYERSLMLNSLCCSTTLMLNNNSNNCCSVSINNPKNADTTSNHQINSNNVNNNTTFMTSSNVMQSNSNNNNDLIFLYDNDLQENSSFIHHGQSAGSTSLSSYCGSSSTSSKKEKKKRRSSSLKELMITIQNSISKFRRRSASEKNDKTTCSIITCTSMTSGSSSISNCVTIGDTTSLSSSRYDNDRQKLLMQSDIINSTNNNNTFMNSKHQMMANATPICASLYATPRINKRNAEESLQSTTKKKLMEKLPQRNLLLPNAPITPFSTTKKNKHPFKQLLSTSEASGPSSSSSSSNAQKDNGNNPSKTENLSAKPPQIITLNSNQLNMLQTPQANSGKAQLIEQTPSTLVNNKTVSSISTNVVNPVIGLHKQLKYEDSPSAALLINQSCDLTSFKPSKYQQHSIEKNLSLASASLSHDCRRHMDSHSKHHHHHHHSSGSSSKHHHHHHHHSGKSSSSSSSSKNHFHHHQNSPSSSSSSTSSSNPKHKHHLYVNAIPSIVSSFSSSGSGHHQHHHSKSSSNRYINQSDLCTQIITGNLDSLTTNHHTKSSSSNKNSNNVSSKPPTNTGQKDDLLLSYSSSNSSSSSSSSNSSNCLSNTYSTNEQANKCCSNNERSLLLLTTSQTNAADNSMRCTLRRGRPNTPKTGLSVDYRIRKSSVPNTPESKHAGSNADNLRINYTISNDDITCSKISSSSLEGNKKALAAKKSSNFIKRKSKSKTSIVSTASLNTAMVDAALQDQDDMDQRCDQEDEEQEDDEDDKISVNNNNKNEDLLDMAFNGDEDLDYEVEEDDVENSDESNSSNVSLSPRSRSVACIKSPSSTNNLSCKLLNNNGRHISLSLNNLPSDNNLDSLMNINNDEEDANDVTKSLIDITNSNNNGEKKTHDVSALLDNQLIKKAYSEKTTGSLNKTVSKLDLENQNELKDNENATERTEMKENEQIDEEKPQQTSNNNISLSIIKEQQKQINFEPFDLFKMPVNPFENQVNLSDDDNMLQNVLRRQSLFKLKEKINGKVSKQINEIEKRKLSPYRFSNSPLKHHQKKKKESMSSLTSSTGHIAKQHKSSPLRMPSLFCKKILSDKQIEENYTVSSKRDNHKLSRTIATSSIKAAMEACNNSSSTSPNTSQRLVIEPKIPVESPLIVRAATQFYKKLNRNRSVKRLNSSTSNNNTTVIANNLSSIPENVSSTSQCDSFVNINNKTSDFEMTSDENKLNMTSSIYQHGNKSANHSMLNRSSQMANANANGGSSPTSKQLISSSEWKCSESIDL